MGVLFRCAYTLLRLWLIVERTVAAFASYPSARPYGTNGQRSAIRYFSYRICWDQTLALGRNPELNADRVLYP